jgi:hypothetical protein
MKKVDQLEEDTQALQTKKTHSGSFFWPLLLITIGGLLLLNNFGIIPWEIWDSLIRFWPVMLILVGLEILLGRSRTTNLIVTLLGIVILLTIIVIYVPSLSQQLNQLISQININFLPIINR